MLCSFNRGALPAAAIDLASAPATAAPRWQGHDWVARPIRARGPTYILGFIYFTGNAGVSGEHIVDIREPSQLLLGLRQPFIILGDWNALLHELP